MAKGKLILICHSGGDFVTNDDGTLSYNGGEATAANVTIETPFNDLKLQLAEVCNMDQKTVTIKYFLPGNKKNLIVVKNDKDVKRMIDFHGDAITAEVFVMGTPGFERTTVEVQSNKKDETVNHDNVGNKKKEPAKRGRLRAKKDDKLPTSPPVKRTRSATATAAAKTAAASDDNQDGDDMSDDAKSDGSANETSSSDSSDSDNENADFDSNSGYGSDYTPKRSVGERKRSSRSAIDIDVDASPADTVKKRRHTPSWKFGANGRPTIVSCPDKGSVWPKSGGRSGKAENSEGKESQRKSSSLADKGDSSQETRSGRKSSVRVADDSDQELDIFSGKELAIYDEYARALPEATVNLWKSAITGIGQEFVSVNEFRAALKKYAIANRFGYKYKKNDTSRAIGGCAAEGCTWKFNAVWVPTTQSFTIKKLNDIHTCDKESRRSAHPAKNWLVGTIKDRLRESPYLKPKEIANGLLQDFGVELNYTQVWRGIGDAREQLHGSLKESYNKLPWFCEKLVETNPGSFAKLVIGEKKRFKSLFVSLHALLIGFQSSCRPLIFLEAASLKSRYGEILLTANAIDGNDGFFLVSFAIVNVEDDDNWHWFLEQLRASILNLQPITFVVDRDKNLKNSVLAVFENAHVGYSIYHLFASFKRNMKGPFHGDGKAFLTVHFLAAAHAVRLVGFKKSMEQIKLISSQAYDWVMQSEPEHWATSSFKGERYNYITEDVGESYAKLMEDYRHLPILQKIDALIRTIIDDTEDAKLDASMWSAQLTQSKEKELEEERVKARALKVLISSDTLFEVREDSTHVVNVSNRSCTCMWWKERGLPCRHALAVFSLTGKNPYEFCSGYFTADAYRLTYAESIHPIPIDGPTLQNPKEEPEKQEGGKEDCEMEDGNKETGEKAEKEECSKKDYEIVGGDMEEGEKMVFLEDERIKVGIEKDERSNVIAEKEKTSKLNAEKIDGSNLDAEKEEGCDFDDEIDKVADVDAKKDEDVNVDGEKDESDNVDTKKDEGGNADVEKDESGNADVEKDEGGDVDVEKDDGGKLDVEKDEGGNLDAEKDEVGKLDVEKDENGNVDAEKEVSELDLEKEGGKSDVDKEECKIVKLREEHEDPNVLVLPPIPAKSFSSTVKKETDGAETDGDMKRKVACSKCKQPGHYKKSCKTKLGT